MSFNAYLERRVFPNFCLCVPPPRGCKTFVFLLLVAAVFAKCLRNLHKSTEALIPKILLVLFSGKFLLFLHISDGSIEIKVIFVKFYATEIYQGYNGFNGRSSKAFRRCLSQKPSGKQRMFIIDRIQEIDAVKKRDFI